MPNKFYDINRSFETPGKSNLDKGKRRTIYYEAEVYEKRTGFPSPNQAIPDR